ncbi:MAG: T9SS type A sorting domain-containing protein, partial [candidate division WOR-3 bacterium]
RSRHQILILSSEIQSKGISIGSKIYSIGFFVKTTNNINLMPCSLKIKEVNYNQIGNSFDNNGLTTIVGYSSCPPLTNNTWSEYTFPTPWTYNGQNLLIDFFYGSPYNYDYTYNASTTYTIYNDTLCGYSYTDFGAIPNDNIYRTNKRPNIRILADIQSSNEEKNNSNFRIKFLESWLIISFNKKLNYSLRIYTANGNIVNEKKSFDNEYKINLKKGIYILELEFEKQRIYRTFVIY